VAGLPTFCGWEPEPSASVTRTPGNQRIVASSGVHRRSRQYDPQTMRFTQEDLIGLAGGLNTYGFATIGSATEDFRCHS
jgi:RHS repeat-associated protein